MMNWRRSVRIAVGIVGLGAFVAGCNTDMWEQPKTKPLSESTFYPDGQTARPLIPGTVARGHLRADTAFFTGRTDDGKFVTKFPLPVTLALLERGRERFTIYCTPCHGQLGNGQGMIAQRGFALKRQPADYNTQRLRDMPIGHFYDVITNGYGTMFSYASRVEPQDRWAIVAYIRALQLSQNAPLSDVPDDILKGMREADQNKVASR